MTQSALHHHAEQPEAFGDELPPGTTLCFGQYEIVRFLNSGGFGITYLALDSLGRKVVIKECFPGAMCHRAGRHLSLRSPSYEMDFERVVELFEREARALAQLQHPSIVGVHQIFKDNGTAYMALDFVPGSDLLQVLEETPRRLGPVEVRRITTVLLDALAYVHRNGILHRDISPDNILLSSDGNPVLIDFGAAREDATRASRILSRVQTVKDGYSPQEFYLASKGAQEVPSDLYALAATIHHLITGAPPPNSTLRLAAVAEGSADPYEPIRGRVDGYDPHFLGAIDRCLSVFARDRLKSAEAWLDEIDETRRRRAQALRVEEDEEIERRISQLVSENSDVEPGATSARAARVAQSAQARAAEATRKAAAERDYWAILNEAVDDVEPTVEEDEGVDPAILAAAEAAAAPARRGLRLKRRLSVLVLLWGIFLVGPFASLLGGTQPGRAFVATEPVESAP